MDPLDEQLAFKLGDSAKEGVDHFSMRRSGIDALTTGGKLNTTPAELFERSDQMWHRAGESVEPPNQHAVHASEANSLHKATQIRAVRLRA